MFLQCTPNLSASRFEITITLTGALEWGPGEGNNGAAGTKPFYDRTSLM